MIENETTGEQKPDGGKERRRRGMGAGILLGICGTLVVGALGIYLTCRFTGSQILITNAAADTDGTTLLDAKTTAKINELLKEGEAAGEKIGVIASTETAADYLGGIVRTIGSRSDELSISRHLFGILRDFDTLQVDRIYSESFETPQMGQAIMNRLMKAAGQKKILV